MSFPIEIARQTRRNFMKVLDGLTIEQLNKIPAGFNNNIAWNFAHIVCSQQTLCYLKANITPRLGMEYINKYKMGTRPEGFISQEEIDFFREKAMTLLDDLEKDLTDDKFAGYEAVTTLFGVKLETITDAVAYFAGHDNLHLGYVLAMRKMI